MLGERLKLLRQAHNLNQVQLAEELHVSKQSVSNWENNSIMPSIEILLKISKYFRVSTDYLLELDDGNYTEDMLSERQRAILNFVREFISIKGYPPSVREIGVAVGLSSSASVHNHLKNLEQFGFLLRDAAKPRALDLISQNDAWRNKQVVPVPLVGKVTAGDVFYFSCSL